MTGAVTRTIEGFEQVEELGRGGFGIVYRAWQPEFGRFVAIKVLAVGQEQHEQGLGREALAIGSLSGHPNIVAVHAVGVTDRGEPYLVMPYLERGSLGDRLATAGPISWSEATSIGVKLAGALQTAHSAGVLHSDVKPDNILFSSFGEPQLADFGIARFTSSARTVGGTVMATVLYAAPEVLAGQPADPAADIYSLASTLYTAVDGRAPFAGAAGEPLAATITRACLEPPSRPTRELPTAVWSVIERGLAKHPSDRFSTAADLGHALQRAQRSSGLPITTINLPEAARSGDTTVVVASGLSDSDQGRVADRRAATVLIASPTAIGVAPSTPRRPPRRWLFVGGAALVLSTVGGWAMLRDRAPGPSDDSPRAASVATSAPVTTTLGPSTSALQPMTLDRLLEVPIPECPVPLGPNGFEAIVGTAQDPSDARTPAATVGDLTGDGVADGAYTTICNGGGSGVFYDTWVFDSSGELLGRLPIAEDAGQTLSSEQSGLTIGNGTISVVAAGPTACTACEPDSYVLLNYSWNGAGFTRLEDGDV